MAVHPTAICWSVALRMAGGSAHTSAACGALAGSPRVLHAEPPTGPHSTGSWTGRPWTHAVLPAGARLLAAPPSWIVPRAVKAPRAGRARRAGARPIRAAVARSLQAAAAGAAARSRRSCAGWPAWTPHAAADRRAGAPSGGVGRRGRRRRARPASCRRCGRRRRLLSSWPACTRTVCGGLALPLAIPQTHAQLGQWGRGGVPAQVPPRAAQCRPARGAPRPAARIDREAAGYAGARVEARAGPPSRPSVPPRCAPGPACPPQSRSWHCDASLCRRGLHERARRACLARSRASTRPGRTAIRPGSTTTLAAASLCAAAVDATP